MTVRRTRGIVAVLVATPSAAALAAAVEAGPGPLASVAAPQPKAPGMAPPNVLSAGLFAQLVAQGSMPLENPTGDIAYYGYRADGPMLPAPGDVQSATHNVEATKTEPDKNTYLVFPHGLAGADGSYTYGTHFLFQGHEGGSPGYLTRVNLDADGAHRVSLLGSTFADGSPLPHSIDGSTWDPFARRLLFTSEDKATGGVIQATPGVPSTIESLAGVIGNGGFEGVQTDSRGSLWLVEDIGGTTGTTNANAKRPHSFIYRFVPIDPANLAAGGRLQVLQVMRPGSEDPILFGGATPDDDILSADEAALHTYGTRFDTRWVTIHDTAVDGMAAFNANTLGHGHGTPFKRPENGVFRPGTGFGEFHFTETGDTNADTEAGSAYGGFGGVYRLRQTSPGSGNGRLTLVYRGDVAHTGFDNIQFLRRNELLVVEDAGDKLHTQRNALDSGYVLDPRVEYGEPAAPALTRFLAEGRDPLRDDRLGAPGRWQRLPERR